MSRDYGKLLIIVMERMKHGNRILVGKLFPLSLDTFTSVNNFKLKIMVNYGSDSFQIIYFTYRLYAVISNVK